jgi:NADH dehydrogenase
MRILLAGGNVSLQRSIVRSLLTEPHEVRVSTDDRAWTAEWSARVEPFGNDEPALHYAASNCDAAILVDRSVAAWTSGEQDDLTDRLIDIATRAGVRRIIRVTSSDRLTSNRQEDAALTDRPEAITIRTTPVYGIGDDPITLFLIMMRSLPVVPILSGTHVVQPIWHEDLARAILAVLSFPASQLNRIVDIAGPDAIAQERLYDLVATLIGRRPARVSLPDFLTDYGQRLANALHLSLPFQTSHLAFAQGSESTLEASDNALSSLFGLDGTSLQDGLRRLLNELDEVTPSQGVGSVEVKRFSIDIRGSRYGAAELLLLFRTRFNEVMPIAVGVEPAAPQVELHEGAVLSMALPGRGHVQVRVEEITDHHAIVSTLRGHALAGIVRFGARTIDDGVRFEVMTCDTAANALDWLTLTLGGARIQDANWTKVVQNVAKLAGGSAGAVEYDARKLEGEEAEHVERWIVTIIERQRTRAASNRSTALPVEHQPRHAVRD